MKWVTNYNPKPRYLTILVIAALPFLLAAHLLCIRNDNKDTIRHFQNIFLQGRNQHGDPRIAIRSFTQTEQKKLLVVDPKTLSTEIINATLFTASTVPDPTGAALLSTPYGKALSTYSAPPYAIENYGLSKAPNKHDGVFLTIDLCPSVKEFEKDFFSYLTTLSHKQEVHVAIALSGSWALHHQRDLDWLITQRRTKTLSITWINHSYHHRYYSHTPLKENFLLSPHTNFIDEVFGVEKLLIKSGETPSVFFRFPGLISNQDAVLALRGLGLIPIASDAWLAKGQTPKAASVILVHGNSNEHAGIEKMMRILKDRSPPKLLPLSKAFEP